MFAYVKYVSGLHAGEKKKVPIAFIKQNIKSASDFDRAKKYPMKYCTDDTNYTHKGLIIFVKEDEKDLEKAIMVERQRVLPNSLLVTASDGSSTSDESELKIKSITQSTKSNIQIKDNLKIKLEQYEFKINKNKSENSMDAGEKNNSDINDAKINEECPVYDEETISNYKHQNDVGGKTNKTENMTPMLRIVRNDRVHSVKECCDETATLQEKIKYLENVHKKDEEIIKSLEKKLHSYKERIKESDKNQKKLAEVRQKYAEAEKRLDELNELNKGIQRKLIESNDESRTVLRNLNNAVEVDTRLNFVPVGVVRKSDDTIHVGQDRWIQRTVFDNVMNAKNPSTAVSNILINIFGEDVLLASTLTGRKSNKSCIGEKPHKLDSSLVKLCQDWYGYWLRNKYIQIAEDVNIVAEYNEFTEYASRKIAYMKRDNQKGATRVCKRKKNSKKGKKHGKFSDDSAGENEPNKKKSVIKKDENIIKNGEEGNNMKIPTKNEKSSSNVIETNNDHIYNFMEFSPVHDSEDSKEEDPLA